MARKFGDIKFCEMRADLCIEGYPERNTPTILVYRNGDVVAQKITLRDLGGVRTTVISTLWFLSCLFLASSLVALADNDCVDLQKLLVDVGAVKETDHRVLPSKEDQEDRNGGSLRRGLQSSRVVDDDDWD